MHSDYLEIIDDFVTGLLKKAQVTHAGNCLLVSEILNQYIALVFNIDGEVVNFTVIDNDNPINHYCIELANGYILDATASQFSKMPRIYYGLPPSNYTSKRQLE